MCEASGVLNKLDLVQLTPFLLRQDEVFLEEDLIHKANTCDIQTQYYKTIPNVLCTEEDPNELSLLNEVFNDDDRLLQEFCFSDSNFLYTHTHLISIGHYYSQFRADQSTQ